MNTSSLPLTQGLSDSEEIYPNSSDGKYFTATQARIYVGNLFLDELVTVQYTYQKNRIPVYGYCSDLADAFGKGKGLVQGQIALNFVAKGYLYVALQNFRKKLNNSIPSSQQTNVALLGTAVNQSAQAQASQNATALTTSNQQIQALAQALGPTGIDAYNASKKSSGHQTFAVDLDIPFDIRFELSGAGRTITKTIKNALLISNDQVYDQSGTVLLDAYGFVARNLV